MAPELFTTDGHLDGRMVWLHVGKRLFGPKWPDVRRHVLACPHCAQILEHLTGMGIPPESRESPDSVVIDFGDIHPDLLGLDASADEEPQTAELSPSVRFVPAAVAAATPVAVPVRPAPPPQAQPVRFAPRAAAQRPPAVLPVSGGNVRGAAARPGFAAPRRAALPDLRPTELDLRAHRRRHGHGRLWLLASAFAAAVIAATVTIVLVKRSRDHKPEISQEPVRIVIDSRVPSSR